MKLKIKTNKKKNLVLALLLLVLVFAVTGYAESAKRIEDEKIQDLSIVESSPEKVLQTKTENNVDAKSLAQDLETESRDQLPRENVNRSPTPAPTTPVPAPISRPVPTPSKPTPPPAPIPAPVAKPTPPPPAPAPSQPVQLSQIDEIIHLINVERRKQNLSEVRVNGKLNSAAFQKSKHMSDNKYFAHTSPDGIADVYFINQSGYSWHAYGSNIARGDFGGSTGLVNAWMNSAGHRANILASFGQEIGIGIFSNYYTMFIARP